MNLTQNIKEFDAEVPNAVNNNGHLKVYQASPKILQTIFYTLDKFFLEFLTNTFFYIIFFEFFKKSF